MIRQLGDDFIVFHHGNYDAAFLRKMLGSYGGLPESFFDGRLHNTLSSIYGKVYFPTYGNSLKEIAAHLGFRRSDADATGLQSIAWRIQWEMSASHGIKAAMKAKLLGYNREDCEGLIVLVSRLRELGSAGRSESLVLCEDLKRQSPYGWGRNSFAFPELEFVNHRAYFDYQREKIYWRTDAEMRKARRARERRAMKETRIDETVASERPMSCPACFSSSIIKHQASSRVVYDLKFTPSGVRRWVVQHRNHRFLCKSCRRTFYPPGRPESAARYGRGLIAWCVYQNIGLRQSQEAVATGLNEIFRFGFDRHAMVAGFKEKAARVYRPTYEEILQRIRSGPLVHVDETRVSVKGQRHYVWVFTNLDEVAYVHASSREGAILKEVLAGFTGVLISDYYPAYDSIDCRQQRCLIHLIRDLNDDLFKNPFDAEYKDLVMRFGRLLKAIMLTIDHRGLKSRYLQSHKTAVEGFYRDCIRVEARSELVRKVQARFEKNEGRLFTFLDHDGIPWNNNNAENAIKGFATLRRVIGGSSTEKGLRESLTLLSIHQTLRNKDRSSLDFFRSGETSFERYLRRKRRSPPEADR